MENKKSFKTRLWQSVKRRNRKNVIRDWIKKRKFINSSEEGDSSPQANCFSPNLTNTTTDPPSIIEVDSSQNEEIEEKTAIDGLRLVDMKYVVEQIQKIDHSPFTCSFRDFEFIKEVRVGFNSVFKFKCRVCNTYESIISNEKSKKINQRVVQSSVCSGSGFAQLEEFCAYLNMPCMSKNLFLKENIILGDLLKDVALECMYQAGKEEKQIAIEKGCVDSEGIPFVTVVTDGSWGKRSYKTNFNSLSGVACIIGFETKKVLFLGIRNSYCSVCAAAKNKNKEPPNHRCFKNWTGTSTAMEADVIAEGFKCSLSMHGLKYTQIIGDGDSSVMSAINKKLPYGHNTPVKKIECSNHLLRNYCAKLRALSKKTENKFGPVPVTLRKKLDSCILPLRKAIKGATNYAKKTISCINEQKTSLQRDIRNSPCHVFGDHAQCQTYYCKGPKPGQENLVPDMKKCGLWYDVYICIAPLLNNVESLLQEKNNNLAEHFNAIVAKFIGGKRVNYALRGSYEARCYAAAVKFNTGNLLHKLQTEDDREFKKFTELYIHRTQKNLAYVRKRKSTYKPPNKAKRFKAADDDYGDLNKEADMSSEEYVKRKEDFLNDLKKTPQEAAILERKTIGQALNTDWVKQRKIRLTASIFGKICKMRPATSCKNTVKDLLYSNFKGNSSTKYGITNEPAAITALETALGKKVQQCGIFIDTVDPFLGASPDGVIDNNAIVEIKCPASVATMTLKDAIEKKKISFCSIEHGKIHLKRAHSYYFQVQGQLHITRREFCFFVVWTPKEFLYEKIDRDDVFWNAKMYPKLRDFYFNSLLPEIIDPRYPRKLPIREKEN